MTRTLNNRLLSHTGTVHWATDGRPACSPVATHSSWLVNTTATVTCKRCIAAFGADEPGHVHFDVDTRDPHIIRREQERAARQAART